MNEVAEASPHTALPTVQPTTRLPKVRHGAQLAVHWPAGVPSTIQHVARLLRRILVLEPRIHVANQVIVVVVAHDQLLQLAVLAHLTPDVLVEGVEMVLQLPFVHLVSRVKGRVVV